MKMIRYRSFAVLSLLLGASALASENTSKALDGGWGSGGGNALVCFDAKDAADTVINRGGEIPDELIGRIQSIETFDLYEARLPRGIPAAPPTLVPVRSGETYIQYVDRILNRVRSVIPQLGDSLNERKERFLKNEIIFHPTSLKRLRDEASASRVEDGRCVLATMAIQQNSGSSWVLHIDQRLFFHPVHSEQSRAVLFLHEVVYALGREKGQSTSQNTRYLVKELIQNGTDVKILPLINRAAGLGFLSYRGELGELTAYKDMGIYYWTYQALFWATQDAYGDVYEFGGLKRELILKEGLADEGTLISRTNEILGELKLPSSADRISEALAYLRRHEDSFGEKLRNPAKAYRVLDQVERFHFAVTNAFAKRIGQLFDAKYRAKVTQYAYLTSEQNDRLGRVAAAMLERLGEIARAYYTKEELAVHEAPLPPNEIRLSENLGVYVAEDLNILFNHDAKKGKRAREWLDDNFNLKFFSEGKFYYETLSEISFPVFRE